jgi:hypothetical protein
MANDPLIDCLARDLKPVRRRTVGRDVALLGVLCLAELALFLGLGLGLGAMRPDMPMAMEQPSFWWRLGSLGLIALVGAAVAVVSFDPVRSPRRGLRWLVAIIAICFAAGWVVDASRDGWPALAARVNWHEGMRCASKVVALSVPAMLGLCLLMRHGAPTDIGGAALASGVAAAA